MSNVTALLKKTTNALAGAAAWAQQNKLADKMLITGSVISSLGIIYMMNTAVHGINIEPSSIKTAAFNAAESFGLKAIVGNMSRLRTLADIPGPLLETIKAPFANNIGLEMWRGMGASVAGTAGIAMGLITKFTARNALVTSPALQPNQLPHPQATTTQQPQFEARTNEGNTQREDSAGAQHDIFDRVNQLEKDLPTQLQNAVKSSPPQPLIENYGIQNLHEDAEQVADFLAANYNLLPAKIQENLRTASPALKNLFSDAKRMAAIEYEVASKLQGVNPAYIQAVKEIISAQGNSQSPAERVRAAGLQIPQIATAQVHYADINVLDRMLELARNNLELSQMYDDPIPSLPESFKQVEQMYGGFRDFYQSVQQSVRHQEVHANLSRIRAIIADVDQAAEIHFQPNLRKLAGTEPAVATRLDDLVKTVAALRVSAGQCKNLAPEVQAEITSIEYSAHLHTAEIRHSVAYGNELKFG